MSLTLALIALAALSTSLALLLNRRGARRRRVLSRLLDAADAFEQRLRQVRTETGADAGSAHDPVHEAMREMLRQRLWLQQYAADAPLARLEAMHDEIEQARQRIDRHLSLLEHARAPAAEPPCTP